MIAPFTLALRLTAAHAIKTSPHSEAANLRADIERGSSLMLKLPVIQQPLLERSWGNFSRLVRKLVHTQQQTALQAKGRFEQSSQRLLAGQWLSLQKAAGDVSRYGARYAHGRTP